MNKLRFPFLTMAALFAVLATTTVAYAQATRTWVSGVGSDANPCSRTAPCLTFAGAIGKTAAGGVIDVLDPGDYGGVTITKAITIDGDHKFAGILGAGTNGVVVQAGAADIVRLVNLDVEGAGTGLSGIRYLSGGELFVEDCKIYGFSQVGIDAEPNDGAAHALTVSHTIIENNGVGGILLSPTNSSSVRATVDDVRVSRNGYGVRAQDGSLVDIQGSIANGNTGDGFSAISASGPVTMNIDGSVAFNQAGAVDSAGVKASGTAAVVRLTNVSLFDNSVGLSAISGGNILSFCDNYNVGNGTNGMPNGTIPPTCPYLSDLPYVAR